MKTYILTAVVIVIVVVGGLIAYRVGETPTHTDTQTLEVVRLAHTSGQFSMNFPVFIGRETGIFETYGLEIVSEEIESGIAVPALIGGSVDYIPYVREGAAAALRDIEVKFVTMLTGNQFQYFLSHRDVATSSIRSVVVPALYGSSHYLALLGMERNGFRADIVDAGNSVPAARAWLLQGRADAGLLSYLAPVDFEAEGFVVLDDFGEDGLIVGLTTTEEIIAQKPDQVQRIVNAFKDIAVYIVEHPDETKELLYTYYNFTERTEAETRKVHSAYEAAAKYFSTTGIPSDTQKQRLVQTSQVVEFSSLDEIRAHEVTDADIAKVFDLRFVE